MQEQKAYEKMENKNHIFIDMKRFIYIHGVHHTPSLLIIGIKI
jgi:hypothetical protein